MDPKDESEDPRPFCTCGQPLEPWDGDSALCLKCREAKAQDLFESTTEAP